MTYRYTFYKIPFSETGVEYPLPEIGNATGSLASYKTFEVLGTAPFRENQTELIITDVEEHAPIDYLLKANYLRVGVVKGTTIEEDTNVNFYWVRDLECLGGLSTFPVRVTIAPDDVMTEFFNCNAEQETYVKGKIFQTSSKTQLASLRKEKPYAPPNKITTYDAPVFKSFYDDDVGYCCVLVSIVTQNAFVETLCIPNVAVRGGAGAGTEYLYDIAHALSTVYKIMWASEASENCNVIGLYAVPNDWVPSSSYVKDIYTLVGKLIGGGDDNIKVSSFSFDSRKTYIRKTVNIPTSEYIDDTDTLYFVTPSRFISYKGNPTEGAHATIFINLPQGSHCADNISINMQLYDEMYDISNDYAITFATNEEAINKAQFGTLYALRGISTGISAMGGLIGGIVSQNYFAAVQSVAAGAEEIGKLVTAGKAPADLTAAPDAFNMFPLTLGLAYLIINNQKEYVQGTIEQYGYEITGHIYIEIEKSDIDEGFYRFLNADVTGLSGGGQDAQATVENLFVRGVRFKEL